MSAPTLGRLVRVELRKAADTRGGFWLLTTLALLGAAVVVLLLGVGEPSERNFPTLLTTAQLPLGVLLPVVGILAVTGEWSQRTALTTFTLVPRRSRVLAAKVLALVALALLAVLASVVAAALGNAVAQAASGAEARWGEPSLLFYVALFQVLGVLVGVGLAMALLSAPQAILAFLVLPTLLTALASLVDALEEPARWLDLAGTTTRLLGGEMTGQAWGRLAVSVAVWAVLPLAVGAVRVHRREVQ